MPRALGALALLLVLTAARAAEAAPICGACGETIGPGRYLVDEWKTTYHAEHAQLPRCTYCGRGISPYTTGGGVRYDDGRTLCAYCQTSAITAPATAERIFRQVRGRMADWGVSWPYEPVPVQLVGLDVLSAQRGGSRTIEGLTTKRWTTEPQSGAVLSRTVKVDMLVGLPRGAFEKAAAHELAHVWMFYDKQPDHATAFEEGACNAFAYRWLTEDPSPEAAAMRRAMNRNPDPAYGEGFRRAWRIVKERGWPGLYDALRAGRDFPPGY